MRRDDWGTPPKLFEYLDKYFSFTLDAAANESNTLCKDFISPEEDALKTLWDGVIFCNPPYTMAKEFVERAIDQIRNPICVSWCLLIPVRSDRIWFQKALHLRCLSHTWITGRLHFGGSGKGAFMYSILLYWHPNQRLLPPYLDAGMFNEGGKGGAKS